MRKQVYHKAKQKPQIGLTLNQVQKSMLEKEITEKSVKIVLALSLIVLRDTFGFGKKRLAKFAQEFLVQLRCIESGAVTFEELNEIIYKETGMEVNFTWLYLFLTSKRNNGGDIDNGNNTILWRPI